MANCLKNYLRYAEAASVGDSDVTQRVLHRLCRWREDHTEQSISSDSVADRLAKSLREQGYRVDRSVGQSHFRCDLAVARKGDAAYRRHPDRYRCLLRTGSLLNVTVMRPRLLRSSGWNLVRVLAKDFCDKPDEVIRAIVDKLQEGYAGQET